MKIRDGFVTNSSSTNFLIISKEELTEEYLLKKLGFKHNSPIKEAGEQLAYSILVGIEYGLRWFKFDYKNPSYDNILEVFGKKSANKFKKLKKKGYKVYLGYTRSEEDYITYFMTCDYFLIDNKDFYMDGRNCVW
jgi:hypothetical protein